ncbi:Ras guanine nucleotide exchange factor [Heterostelium album PN500]|uniref:Ras guanine nucleotide exchange factor n=1 Tax=Heterostelium pallidum (strain ATCC 26659 / Pp 5 / PN500) TaxID=670386 RepID=D3AY46_HETP5|nr:Ras guanine nucleotide exchange factor [Heterostelium album PN500]EFA85873.1 Ras guanine nucleotide exchange factor [Heterostelium album PN500]|eukprot:XP_020437979.1 Ras guanine nucleotide exchange factor [Heterostelium album PN500]
MNNYNNINNNNNNNINSSNNFHSSKNGVLNNETFLYRINELEVIFKHEENSRLQYRVMELEAVNGHLKEQLEYFQTKLLERSFNEDRDLSNCLSDIYESMSKDSQLSSSPPTYPAQTVPNSSMKTVRPTPNVNSHNVQAPMVSPRTSNNVTPLGVPNSALRKPILIRSTSETYLQQSPDIADGDVAGNNSPPNEERVQHSHSSSVSSLTGSSSNGNNANKNWSAAKVRSDSIASTKDSFLRFPATPLSGSNNIPQSPPPLSISANPAASLPNGRIINSNSTSSNQLSSSTPVFTNPTSSPVYHPSSPISLVSSGSSINSFSYSSSPPLASPDSLGSSASSADGFKERRKIPPQPLPPIPNDRRSKTSPFPSNTPAPMSNPSLVRTSSVAPKPVGLSTSAGRPSTPTLLAAAEDDAFEEPENLDDPNLVLIKSETGAYLVKGGTLERLVQRLSYDKSHDTDFASAFLLTYRSFTTPIELMDMLIKSYNITDDSSMPSAQLDKKRRIVRLRVANVIKMWLDKHFHDFSDDAALVAKVDHFINNHINIDLEGIGRNLKKLLNNERMAPIPVFNEDPPAVIAPKVRDPNFIDLDTTEIARQLTLIESELYRKIESKECLGQSWNKQNKDELAPNIVAFIRRFNAVSNWVATEIVRTEKLKERVSVVKRFIIIAQKCRDIGNFNGCMEILSGLQNASVYRLSKTWEKIESKPLLKNIYDELLVLMAQKNNFKDYRAALHSVHPPCIPYLGVYLTDLTFIEDGTKNTLNNCDDIINFEKRRRISVVIREIKQYQQTPYHFRVEDATSRYVKNIPGLTEKALYKYKILEAYLEDFDNEVINIQYVVVDIRCHRMREEAELICTTIRNQFAIDLIKIPQSIRSMTMKEFIEKYNDSLTNKTTEINNSNNNSQPINTSPSTSMVVEEMEDIKKKMIELLNAPIIANTK